jgi:acylphosphatase
VTIKGRVQGVFYRVFVKDHADSLGVKGWVRNLPDGNVEAVIEGEENAFYALIEECRRGPPLAKIEGVDILEEPFKGEFTRFTIER